MDTQFHIDDGPETLFINVETGSADGQRQSAQPVSHDPGSLSGSRGRVRPPPSSRRRNDAQSHLWAAVSAAFALALTNVAWATEPDLARAEQLVAEKRYQEAYDLLAPFGESMAHSASFNYLAGRAALGAKQAEKARVLLTRSLATQPDSVAAHLALGRAYFELGMFAEAKLAFETVFRFDNLPPDLESQVRIYVRVAESYLETGARLLGFGYAATGVGQYRVNATRGTNALGGGDRRDTFYNARVGGDLNYELADNYALDGSLDYRFRYYDNPDSRNDSDLRWRAAGSRALDEGNLALGVRGRVSYRGESAYRNDYGVFTDYRYRLDPDNQVSVGAELRRRRYPEGRLRERTFSTAVANVGWVHSLAAGQASVSLNAHAGYNFATGRPDGESTVYGLTGTFDFTLTDHVSGFIFGWWEHDSFDAERFHFHPDAIDQAVSLQRQDNLYEVGAGLVWDLGRGWSLRPEVLYIRDQSNATAFNYSSTEAWINVRVDF